MKFSDTIENESFNSGQTSSNVRALSLAGLGLLWLLAGQKVGPLAPDLLPTALLLIIALALDFAQYAIGSLRWYLFNKRTDEAGIRLDDEVEVPDTIHRPMYLFYWLKLLAMLASYILLGSNLIARFGGPTP